MPWHLILHARGVSSFGYTDVVYKLLLFYKAANKDATQKGTEYPTSQEILGRPV